MNNPISASVRDYVLSVFRKKTPGWGDETRWKCIEAGLLDLDGELTPAGKALGEEEEAKRVKKNKANAAAAKTRSGVLRDLGLRRTRNGWELPFPGARRGVGLPERVRARVGAVVGWLTPRNRHCAIVDFPLTPWST